MEPTKTRILEFGRFAAENAAKRGKKTETFDFLGFTHYCSRTRDGKRFRIKRRTARKKFNAKLKEFKNFIKKSRTQKTSEFMKKVQAKLLGHYQYYGVTNNSKGIARFYYEVVRLLYKWLNRRGKRKSMNWDKFMLLLERYPLLKPKIYKCPRIFIRS